MTWVQWVLQEKSVRLFKRQETDQQSFALGNSHTRLSPSLIKKTFYIKKYIQPLFLFSYMHANFNYFDPFIIQDTIQCGHEMLVVVFLGFYTLLISGFTHIWFIIFSSCILFTCSNLSVCIYTDTLFSSYSLTYFKILMQSVSFTSEIFRNHGILPINNIIYILC